MLPLTKMAGPPAKKTRTDNKGALHRIQDHNSLVEDDSSEGLVTATAVAGLDDNDDSSSSSDGKDNLHNLQPTTPSDSGVEIGPQTVLAAPVTGKLKRQKKPKKSKAVIDGLLDDDNNSALLNIYNPRTNCSLY